jgi:hypothetical protein
MDETVVYCAVIAVANAIVLVMYHFWLDPNKDMERYYFRSCKVRYTIFKMAYFIIMVSCVMSARYIIYGGFKKAYSLMMT